jgi:hypothetical protein
MEQIHGFSRHGVFHHFFFAQNLDLVNFQPRLITVLHVGFPKSSPLKPPSNHHFEITISGG